MAGYLPWFYRLALTDEPMFDDDALDEQLAGGVPASLIGAYSGVARRILIPVVTQVDQDRTAGRRRGERPAAEPDHPRQNQLFQIQQVGHLAADDGGPPPGPAFPPARLFAQAIISGLTEKGDRVSAAPGLFRRADDESI